MKLFRGKGKEVYLLLISIFFGIIFFIIFFEIYFSLRFGMDKLTQFDPELGWVNIPNAKINDDRGTTYTTNSLGYRGGEVDKSKKHIVLVGDSIIYGSGVNDSETLANNLDKKIKDYQVINLGVGGYGIGQYYLRLKKEINRLNPILIIVNIYEGNDLGETLSGSSYGYEKPLFYIKKENLKKKEVGANFVNHSNLKLLKTKIAKSSCTNIFSKSWILRHSIFSSYRKKFCDINTTPISEGDYLITALLMKFSLLARKHNAKLIFTLSPTRADYNYNIKTPENFGVYRFLKFFSNEKTIKPEDYSVMARISFRRIFNNFKIRYGFLYQFKFYDFFDYLKNKKIDQDDVFLNYDVGHPSASGNKFMAEFIYGKLKSNNAIP